jgi:hypothetical protein
MIGTSWFSCQVAPSPRITCSICGPMIGQISTHDSRPGAPRIDGCFSAPIEREYASL